MGPHRTSLRVSSLSQLRLPAAQPSGATANRGREAGKWHKGRGGGAAGHEGDGVVKRGQERVEEAEWGQDELRAEGGVLAVWSRVRNCT